MQCSKQHGAPNCMLKHELLDTLCIRMFPTLSDFYHAEYDKEMGCASHAHQELRIDTLRSLIGGVGGFWLYTICTV